MRLIDVDELNTIKFHPLPYTHIVPDDVNAESYERGWNDAVDSIIENATTIEPERKTGQKYTNKELKIFMHGISMRLLSLRSAQHWKYDDETAEEIKFLERLYKKVESEVTQ